MKETMDKKKLIAGVTVATILAIAVGGTAIAAQQGALPGQDNESAVTGTVAAPEAKSEQNDANEARQLERLAKIDRKAAEDAALAAVPGTVKDVKLEDENGSVVYAVKVQASDGTLQEVLVDAGNGQVLAQGAEDNDANEVPEAGEATG